jgi:transposase
MVCHQVDAAEQVAQRTRVNDRRVLEGIFWVLRSRAPWRDLSIALVGTPPVTIVPLAGGGATRTHTWTQWRAELAGPMRRPGSPSEREFEQFLPVR